MSAVVVGGGVAGARTQHPLSRRKLDLHSVGALEGPCHQLPRYPQCLLENDGAELGIGALGGG